MTCMFQVASCLAQQLSVENLNGMLGCSDKRSSTPWCSVCWGAIQTHERDQKSGVTINSRQIEGSFLTHLSIRFFTGWQYLRYCGGWKVKNGTDLPANRDGLYAGLDLSWRCCFKQGYRRRGEGVGNVLVAKDVGFNLYVHPSTDGSVDREEDSVALVSWDCRIWPEELQRAMCYFLKHVFLGWVLLTIMTTSIITTITEHHHNDRCISLEIRGPKRRRLQAAGSVFVVCWIKI